MRPAAQFGEEAARQGLPFNSRHRAPGPPWLHCRTSLHRGARVRPCLYRIAFSRDAHAHLASLPVHRRRPVADAIRQQLASQPLVRTRNRFPMQPNSLATWELRVDAERVYYDVVDDLVRIQAIGTKRGNRVMIGGEERDFGD